MQWYVDQACHLTTTTIIEDFLRDLQANTVVSTHNLIILQNIIPNLIIINHNGSKYAETKFTTPELKIIILPLGETCSVWLLKITTSSYLHEFYDYVIYFTILMTNYAWNNYVLSKAIKLWKLITWVMNVKTWIRKYRYEACNGGFDVIPLHVLNSGRKWWWWWQQLSTKIKMKEKLCCLASFDKGWLFLDKWKVDEG